MVKFIQIFCCLLSASTVYLAEYLAFTNQVLNIGEPGSLVFAFINLGSVIFLQIQIYNYIVPKPLRDKLSAERPNYDSESFFKGTVGIGYLFVAMHILMLFHSNQHIGSMILGVLLIFFGVLSKVKAAISTGFSQIDQRPYNKSNNENAIVSGGDAQNARPF